MCWLIADVFASAEKDISDMFAASLSLKDREQPRRPTPEQ